MNLKSIRLRLHLSVFDGRTSNAFLEEAVEMLGVLESQFV